MPDHFDDLLQGGVEFLAQFNRRGRFSGANCPATAGAVAHFLETGEVRPARATMGGDGFQNMGAPMQTARLRRILRVLERGGHGTYVVVGGFSSTREHYNILVNIRGEVYYVDAHTQPAVFATDIAARLQWAEHLEYTRDFQPRFLPEGAAPRAVITDN